MSPLVVATRHPVVATRLPAAPRPEVPHQGAAAAGVPPAVVLPAVVLPAVVHPAVVTRLPVVARLPVVVIPARRVVARLRGVAGMASLPAANPRAVSPPADSERPLRVGADGARLPVRSSSTRLLARRPVASGRR